MIGNVCDICQIYVFAIFLTENIRYFRYFLHLCQNMFNNFDIFPTSNLSVLFPYSQFSLQCFDAVGWAAGRASGL